MDKIAQALRAVMTEIQAMPEPQQPGAADRKEFALLLSGIATCRKAPGIPVHMGYVNGERGYSRLSLFVVYWMGKSYKKEE